MGRQFLESYLVAAIEGNGGWYACGLKNFLENWNSLPIKDGYDKRV